MVAVRTCDTHADDDSPWTSELHARLDGHRLFWPQIRAQMRAAPSGDLPRYTLGLVQDPTAAAVRVGNPAVQRLVREVVEQAARHNVETYLCGHTFSAEPAALLPLKKLLMEERLSPAAAEQ